MSAEEADDWIVKCKVVFRRDKRKPYRVFAIFPEIAADHLGFEVTVFDYVGGHCGGSFYDLIYRSRPALPEEYQELGAYLREGYGYDWTAIQRVPYHIHRQRMDEAQRHLREMQEG